MALAYLALTFANLDRAALAGEVLDVLGPRAKTEPAGPGQRPRAATGRGTSQHPWHRAAAETTALAALAFARGRPQAPELAGAIDWLLAHRAGTGWQPPKAKGPALAALASYLRPGPGRRGPLPAGRHRQRRRGPSRRGRRPGRGQGHPRARARR